MMHQTRLIAPAGFTVVVAVLIATLVLSLEGDWTSIAILGVWLTTTAAVGAVVTAKRSDTSEEEWAGFLVIVAGLLFVPVSMGIGILRHRLYDIDVVVNRALVYGSLTAILAGLYTGSVVLLQRLLQPITPDSDLAVAASTLAVAALFRPARSQVQTFIDQRFYRRKYDASKTLRDFSSQLRDQVDLDSLTRELVGVVSSTMQPSHASVWLRTGAAS